MSYFTNNFPGLRFTNAVQARSFLTNPLGVVVSGSTTIINGTYQRLTSTEYSNTASGFYFIKLGSDWQLRDFNNVIVDTSYGNQLFPWRETGWTGPLNGASLLNAGAGWTITGDQLV